MAEFTPHLFGIFMYHVYVLKSGKDKSLYVGYTKNIEQRLNTHNSGGVKYTKDKGPWKLVYYESFLSLDDAQQREKGLKHYGKAFGQLKRRINRSLNG